MSYESTRAEIVNEITKVKTVLKRVPTAEEFALVICERSTGKVYVACPYCPKIHLHGSEVGAVIGKIGWRMSHCENNSKMYYIQSEGIVPKAHLSKALKHL